MRGGFLVLCADELDEVVVDHQAQRFDRSGLPWFLMRLVARMPDSF
jgi:hypothetical protein